MRSPAALAAVLVVAATACGSDGPPADPPNVVGAVVQLDGAAVLVDDDNPEVCGACFTLAPDVRVLREAGGGGYEQDTWSALTVGRPVEVWVAPGRSPRRAVPHARSLELFC